MKRNVILVTIDSLRADHCGYWGYGRDTTPTLDRMARNGIVFENAIAPGPKTPESMPVIFTGDFPTVDLDSAEIGSWREQIFPHMRARDSIAEQFSRRGYTTGAFTPNGFTSEYFGFDAGFQHFEDFLTDELRPGLNVPNIARGVIKWIRQEGNWKLWEKYYESVLQFIEEASEPYFLWVFLLDVHSPYLVPRKYRTENSWVGMMYANWKRGDAGMSPSTRRRLISAYDDTIRYSDEFLRRLQEDTTGSTPAIVIHSDHGEAFGEHGIHGHERYLFEENVHVPFVVANVNASDRITAPVSLCQLPGILDAVSREASSDAATDIRASLDIGQRPVVFRSTEGDFHGVRAGRFKLLTGGREALYDLRADPDEQDDVSEAHPALRDALKGIAENHSSSNSEKRTISRRASDLLEDRSNAVRL